MTTSIILLTALSLVSRRCLLIIGNQTAWKIKSKETAYNKQQQSNLQNLVETLYSKNEDAMKELIFSQCNMLCQVVALINRGADDLSERRNINKSFFDCLTKVKQGQPQALVWLKKNIDPEVCTIMFSDWKFSNAWHEVMNDKVSAIKKKIEKLVTEFINSRCTGMIATCLKFSYDGLLRLAMVAFSYLDLTLDSFLLYEVCLVLDSTLHEATLFSTQVTILLICSIFVPLFITAVTIAYKRPLVVLDYDCWMKWNASKNQNAGAIMILRILIVCLFPLVPAMIIFSSEKAKEQRKFLENKHLKKDEEISVCLLEESRELTAYIKETRMALLTAKRNELSIELVIQLSVHLMMVLLSLSSFPVESGLQSLFQSTTKSAVRSNATLIFLIFSVVLSFKTSALTSIKIKADTKIFLPLFPKVVLGVRYLLIFLIRIGAIVFYYAPFIGVLDIMSHNYAESIPLDYETFTYVNDTDLQEYHYWNEIELEFQSIGISQLYRVDYTDTKYPQPPSTMLYTIISLGTAYIIFWAILIIYGLVLTAIKSCLNNEFRLATFGKKFQHIVFALNMPEAFGDWDDDQDLDVAGHLIRWWKVLVEMLVMIFAQLLFNMILLVPIWVTGMKLGTIHFLSLQKPSLSISHDLFLLSKLKMIK